MSGVPTEYAPRSQEMSMLQFVDQGLACLPFSMPITVQTSHQHPLYARLSRTMTLTKHNAIAVPPSVLPPVPPYVRITSIPRPRRMRHDTTHKCCDDYACHNRDHT